MNEKTWQEQVIQLATYCQFVHFHPFDMRRSDPGWPDLVLARPPELLFVELKSDKGRLTENQRWWIDTLRACGQEVHVWRPKHFPEVNARLQRRRPAPLEPS